MHRPTPKTARLRASAKRVHALRATALASALAGMTVCADLHAQTVPDAGSLLRESERQTPKLPPLPAVEAPKLLKDTGIKVVVKRFEVTGSQRYPATRVDALLTDLVGQELGFAQMQAAADRVAALYRTDGLHATAFLPEQTLQDGLLRITVVEGRFGKLKVESRPESSKRIPLKLIGKMLAAGQTPGDMIDTRRLEGATLVANDLPGAQVSAILAAGEAPGETDIVAQIDPRPLLSGVGTLDNEDPRATGRTKLGVNLSLAELAGIGDQAQFAANATEGKVYLRGAYDLALGASGWRAGVNVSTMQYRLQGEFASSGAKGRATTAGVTTSLPLLRGVERNLYATASFEHRHLVNDSNAGRLSDKTLDVVTVGANGDTTDHLGGGGANVAGIAITGGKLDLDHDAADLAGDAAGPRRNGRYLKLAANLSRLQRISENGALWLTANGQISSKNLDSSEQFSLGGPNGVRAYPALEGSGDEGWIASAEYRHRINDAWQVNAFYDHGQIARSHTTQAGAPDPNRYALKGVGAGVVWHLKQIAVLHAMAATRIGSNPAAGPTGKDGDGTKRRPQLWLLAEVPF